MKKLKDMTREEKFRLWQLLIAKEEKRSPVGLIILLVLTGLLLLWPISQAVLDHL